MVNYLFECICCNLKHIVNVTIDDHWIIFKIFSEFNTFSKSFDCPCGAGIFCQYDKDMKSAQGEQWVVCDRCLVWFHKRCVVFWPRKMGKMWSCGCEKPDDEISDGYVLSIINY